jgi:hypothetical protein
MHDGAMRYLCGVSGGCLLPVRAYLRMRRLDVLSVPTCGVDSIWVNAAVVSMLDGSLEKLTKGGCACAVPPAKHVVMTIDLLAVTCWPMQISVSWCACSLFVVAHTLLCFADTAAMLGFQRAVVMQASTDAVQMALLPAGRAFLSFLGSLLCYCTAASGASTVFGGGSNWMRCLMTVCLVPCRYAEVWWIALPVNAVVVLCAACAAVA